MITWGMGSVSSGLFSAGLLLMVEQGTARADVIVTGRFLVIEDMNHQHQAIMYKFKSDFKTAKYAV